MENNTNDNLRKAQLHCVGILEDIDKICRKHGIKYSLTAGTTIGWHLYGGFIPWDDDIDLMMTRENYEKFLDICESELPEKYQLCNFENKRETKILFSKIVDTQTTYVEKLLSGEYRVSGVFVDVSVFDKCPRAKLNNLYYQFLSKTVQFCTTKNGDGQGAFIELIKSIGRFLMKPFSKSYYGFVKNTFINGCKSDYDYAELMFGLKNMYSPAIFESYIDVQFEGKTAMLVENYMGYLEARYGRREFYKQQKPNDLPHHVVFVDCEMPYKEYKNLHK